MYRIGAFLIIAFLLFTSDIFGQFLIPGEGIMDVKLGSDWDQIEWELGFKGKKVNFEQADERIKLLAEQAGIEFDFMISYNHLMWLPISELLFKDDKVCLVQLSSYPEYNQMMSADIGTIDGLNFWDSAKEINQLYTNSRFIQNGEKTIIIVKEKGLGLELSENQVRTMFIFEPN